MLSRAQNTFHHNPRLRGPVSSIIYMYRDFCVKKFHVHYRRIYTMNAEDIFRSSIGCEIMLNQVYIFKVYRSAVCCHARIEEFSLGGGGGGGGTSI